MKTMASSGAPEELATAAPIVASFMLVVLSLWLFTICGNRTRFKKGIEMMTLGRFNIDISFPSIKSWYLLFMLYFKLLPVDCVPICYSCYSTVVTC